MQQNFDTINFLVGNKHLLSEINETKALPLFSDIVVNFLSELSNKIMANPASKEYADVVSYAFWIRKASIEKEKKRYDLNKKIGRGVALHIAPSNVPVAFAMSFTAALLAGNPCVVRVSAKEYKQVNIICSTINEVITAQSQEMSKYLIIIRYEHDEEITQALTDLCDIRIIWGGDRTINTIRKAHLPSRAIEMTFADRHSISIIDADKYLELNHEKVAKDFYADTFFIDQNACSSPRLIIWIGKSIDKAKSVFWENLKKIVDRDYSLQPVKVVDKLDSFCRLAAFYKGVRLEKANNSIYRVQVKELNKDIMEFKDNCGYFFEYDAKNLNEICPVLSKKCQTISYLGINPIEIRNIVFNNGVKGGDRIVPMGQTMELTFIWDGYDLIDTMSRILNIR